MRPGKGFVALALALIVACGDDGGDSLFAPEGVWAGELTGTRAGRPVALCLEIDNFDTTRPPERFSGALYMERVRHELVVGTWGPGDVLSFAAENGSFTGVVAVERLYGSWLAPPGGPFQDRGGWTLDRTDKRSCQ